MSPEEARELFIPIHGSVGVLALTLGFIILAMRKGNRRHRLMGRGFVVAMFIAIFASVPVLWATANLFLTGMGTIAAYLVWTGWRIAALKSRAGGSIDQGISIAMTCIGVAFAGFGIYAFTRGSGVIAVVPIIMGGLSAQVAVEHFRWYRTPNEARKSWVQMHLGAIGGGFIAGLTAFAAAAGTRNLPMVPEWILWIGPTILFGPILNRFSNQAKESN